MTCTHFRTAIVGGGPAGLAPLVAASRDGRLDRLLSGGLAIVDRGERLGAGLLGGYDIQSDSTAATFMTAVEDHLDPRLGALRLGSIYGSLAERGRSAVPLRLVSDFLSEVGAILSRATAAAGGLVLQGHDAVSARRCRSGRWHLQLRGAADGTEGEITCDTLILATGGAQGRERLASEHVAGRPLLPTHADRLLLSDEILRLGGVARVRAMLEGKAEPRIVIAGSSTSALAVTTLLLRRLPQALAGPGFITVLHRRTPRVFYASAAEALAEGYDDFGADDVCPVSGFVYRLAGFREESREMAMAMLGIGGRAPERRARFMAIDGEDREVHGLLAGADLVVAALGYRPNLLPLYDARGGAIALAGQSGAPAVDDVCRVVDAAGVPVPGVLAVGLAAGFRPQGRFGGEPSFKGQANGLWLWQNAVGSAIVDAALRRQPRPRSRPARRAAAPSPAVGWMVACAETSPRHEHARMA